MRGFADVVRMPHPVKRPTDALRLLEACVRLVRAQTDPARVAWRWEREGELGSLEMDEAQMEQALINVLKNAVEALPAEGGTVTVRAGRAAGAGTSRLRIPARVFPTRPGRTCSRRSSPPSRTARASASPWCRRSSAATASATPSTARPAGRRCSGSSSKPKAAIRNRRRGWPIRFPSGRRQDRRSPAEHRWERFGQDPHPTATIQAVKPASFRR